MARARRWVPTGAVRAPYPGYVSTAGRRDMGSGGEGSAFDRLEGCGGLVAEAAEPAVVG